MQRALIGHVCVCVCVCVCVALSRLYIYIFSMQTGSQHGNHTGMSVC